ncbi:hypothetical protein PV10_00796 [Exophiala mesophila]|uniref:Mid2 domain-containing protein n=1 Tax=Exophiala mesophila TaxID=212818 RepID=A0A0D1Y8F8_EXOME|nr:uncharacterized protein PV10_00796 [Exophiala mesophila]KIV96986.1 hypothetical protein PV10_00796 [Exophiala mesophila]
MTVNPGNGIQLFPCGNEDAYCCGRDNLNDTSCCNDPEAFFVTLPNPTTIGQIVSTAFVPESTTFSPSTSSSSPSTTSIASGSGASATRNASMPTDTNISNGGDGSNVGAIAGGSVGGLAVLGGLIFAAWWLYIRKRKETHKRAELYGNSMQSGPGELDSGQRMFPQEMYSDSQQELDSGQRMFPQEMDSESQRRKQIAPYELPATREEKG